MSEEHYQRCRRNILAMTPERRGHYIRWLADHGSLLSDGEYMQLVALCDEMTRIERFLKGGATHGPQAHA